MPVFSGRKELLEICRLVYDRSLTDAAGSNFSVRASADTFLVTATGNAKRTRLRMSPDDLLLLGSDDTVLEGRGKPTSSWPTHRTLFEAFPAVGAVIHAHPKLATVVACGEGPMTPVLDAMKKYGEVPLVPRALQVDSPEFGRWIVDALRPNEARLERHALGVLYPFHGVLVAGPDLDEAFDLLERMEFNAAALLWGPRQHPDKIPSSLE